MEKYIEDYEGLYKVTSEGQIWSEYSRSYLKPFADNRGYLRVRLYKEGRARTVLISRMVALAFVNNPDNLCTVNHKNGNKLDNSMENLEWMSLSDNVKHAYQSGLNSSSGSNNPNAKLTPEQVREIRATYKPYKVTATDLANKFGVDVSTIRRAASNYTWSMAG